MCTHSLRTSFLGSNVSTGGTWTYIGYNELFKQGPFNANASVPPAALVGAVPLALVGDNPSIDWTGADAGYYYFTYDLGSCGGSADLIVYVKEACFLSTVTLNIHNQQDPIYLNELVGTGLSCTVPAGYWQLTSGTLDAFDGLQGIFYPDRVQSGTSHTMEYKISRNCSDCKSSFTINVFTCTSSNLCHYFTDFSETLEQVDLDNSELLSFKVGGVEQLTLPVTFGPKNVITYGVKPYLTNLVDTLNDLNIPCFKFYYSTLTVSAETRQKFMRICAPQGVDWEIKLYCAGGSPTYWIYTESDVTFSYDDVTYNSLFATPFYNVLAGVTTGIEFCKVTGTCE